MNDKPNNVELHAFGGAKFMVSAKKLAQMVSAKIAFLCAECSDLREAIAGSSGCIVDTSAGTGGDLDLVLTFLLQHKKCRKELQALELLKTALDSSCGADQWLSMADFKLLSLK